MSFTEANDAVFEAVIANEDLMFVIEIFAPPSGKKVRAITRGQSGAHNQLNVRMMAHYWNNTSNVTQITLTSTVTNAIGVGSYIEIWRRTY